MRQLNGVRLKCKLSAVASYIDKQINALFT